MDTTTARQMLNGLMAEHGLVGKGWTSAWDSSRQRFGLCSFKKKTISLSIHLVALNPEHEVRDTILHEIAHALVGPSEGHGTKWVLCARSIGCRGTRCHSAERPPGRLKATCPGCARVFYRERAPKRRMCCARCSRYGFNEKFLLAWTLNMDEIAKRGGKWR